MELVDSRFDQHFQIVKSSQNLYFLSSEGSEAASLAVPGGHLWPAAFAVAHVPFHCEDLASLLTDSYPPFDGTSDLSLGKTHRLNVTVLLQLEGPSASVC